MTIQQGIMLVIFLATFVGLVRFQRSPEKVFAGVTLLCLALSLVSLEQVLHNIVNPGLVTLVVLVICSFAIERTSFLRRAGQFLINGSETLSLLRLCLASAFSSALMNNTAVVATLIEPIKKNQRINAGKLLLPLSFAAILGGTITLVGTSTNLLVNSLLVDKGVPGFAFFDFTIIGLSATGAGIAVMMLSYRFLPELQLTSHKQKHYFLDAIVEANSTLVGLSIEQNGLRNLEALFLVEVVRKGQLISPISPDFIIQAGDRLIFTGDIAQVRALQHFNGLTLFAEQKVGLEQNLNEVLIKPNSVLVGKTLKSTSFRARFDAAVVAIRREGHRLSGKLGDITLEAGDFLVLAVGRDFAQRPNLTKNFYLLDGVKPHHLLSGWRDKLAVLGFLATILVTTLSGAPLLYGLVFYLALLLATRCLSSNEIKRRFPLEIATIVVGALTLTKGMEQTGIAQLVANLVNSHLSSFTPIVALVAVFIATLIVTEFMTNTAAAALVFPIAFNIALGLQVDATPFALAVAFAASGSFMSPYGYQTNIMVYNAGNYRLADFIRFGLPVSLVYSVVVLTLLPRLFPF